ncbi:MAG: glutathione S-transferase family protein [Parvularculaceae bacterium]
MRTLLHSPLDPPSRAIRLVLAEKNLTVRLVNVAPCSTNEELLQRNPAGAPPVLIDEPPTGGEVAISPGPAIAEYLEDAYGATALMPSTSAGRAEVRRLVHWFESKFESEVNARVLRRKIDDRIEGKYRLDPDLYRQGLERLSWHLDYLSYLLERRAWLASERMTLADLHGAAHLSSTDYIGAVPWTDFPAVKEWYQRVKCRPGFRPLLADRIEGVPPPAHYADLDF